MGYDQITSEYRKESISFSCVLVSIVFFLVLSQALIIKLPEIVTQIFRPIVVISLTIRMCQRGQVHFSARSIALITAIYCVLDLILTRIDVDELTRASAVVLYLLMFYAVTGTPWNKREIRTIIMACFAGAFVCAVAILLSNDPTDINVGTSGNMNMFGTHVNRNKNAYAFCLGTILGIVYLIYGEKLKKFWVFIMTAVIIYALLYSQCRGAFICAVAGVVIIIGGLLLKVKKKDSGKFVVYSILVILLCIVIYYFLKSSAFNRLIDGDSKSGRDEGIKHAWNLFLNSELFGKVFGNGYGYEGAHTEGIGAHFVYVTYLLAIGIVGCSLISLMLICSGLRIKGEVSYALFASAFLKTFFEGLDYYIYIPLILSTIIYNYSLIHRRNYSELFSGK